MDQRSILDESRGDFQGGFSRHLIRREHIHISAVLYGTRARYRPSSLSVFDADVARFTATVGKTGANEALLHVSQVSRSVNV